MFAPWRSQQHHLRVNRDPITGNSFIAATPPCLHTRKPSPTLPGYRPIYLETKKKYPVISPPPPPPDISPPLVSLFSSDDIKYSCRTLYYFKHKVRKDCGTIITERIKCRKPCRRELDIQIFNAGKMSTEFPVCCVPVTFTSISFDFVPKIETHLIYNEA